MILIDFLQQYFIISSILFICGEPISIDLFFFTSLQFLFLLNLFHYLGSWLSSRSKRNRMKDQEEENKNEKFSLFDLNHQQQPEVYSFLLGAVIASIACVLDWRTWWTEFPRLSIAVGGAAGILCFVIRLLFV
jgi:hypothetical protein